MRTHLRRALALTAVGSVVTATALLASSGVALADDSSSGNPNAYSLTAEGDGMYYEVSDGQLPAVTDTAVSPYSASSTLDSEGTSAAFAGLPYLGTTAETLPGTVNGLSGGGTPPIPPVPGYVSTNYPSSKTAKQSNGPYLLTANSSQYESDANAGGGQSPNAGSTNQQIYSSAKSIANNDGSVSSVASAGVEGLNVSVIDALNVSSTVSMALKGDRSAPTVVNNTNDGTFTVAGIKIGMDQNGFNVLSTPLPIPTQTALDTVNTALGGAGLKIEIVPSAQVTDPTTNQVTSVSSGGLRITVLEDVPTQGPTMLQFTYGRATVTATDASFGGDTSDDSSTSTDTSTTSTTTDTTPASTAPAATDTTATDTAPVATDTSGLASTDTGSLPLDTGTTATVPDTSAPAPSVADNSAGVTSSHPTSLGYIKAASASPQGTSSRAIYLVLVLGAAIILGGQQLFRGLAVRLLLRQS